MTLSSTFLKPLACRCGVDLDPFAFEVAPAQFILRVAATVTYGVPWGRLRHLQASEGRGGPLKDYTGGSGHVHYDFHTS